MYQEEATVRVKQAHNQMQMSDLMIDIFDGNRQPQRVRLMDFKKAVVTFGRDQSNDIVMASPLVSSEHGRFLFKAGVWYIEDKAVYRDRGSTNGIIYNNTQIESRAMSDGDFFRIDDGVETVKDGVLFVVSGAESDNRWETLPLSAAPVITIGRAFDCNIVLPHISVSKCHAKIVRENGGYYIVDNNSVNGVIVNNRRISGKEKLNEKDVITITNSKLIFTSSAISYRCYKIGVSVDASDVVIRRGKGRKAFTTCNHVSLNVKPGELIAVIGGSGAGKSTILNCMCGYLKPQHGDVYINGIDLYRNFDSIKKLIGYVPQSDIVYDNLTLHDMLLYTAKLRLPGDVSAAEREKTINNAIEMVELTEKRNSLIRSLSGGQRKRASIAVELISDPNLLFLDEPASGLDPGTERSLMQSLRNMADGGKTVILVTHSTLQLKLCDKIVFMGKGGNLCYFGSHDEALEFFGLDDIVGVYQMITDHAKEWSERYKQTLAPAGKTRAVAGKTSATKENKFRQFSVLCTRYMKLVMNDRQRLLLLLFQAPILAFLISIVANGKEFTQYEMTKSLLFALSCSAFWIGMLNAIQEVCKERTILKREYMTGLSIGSYVLSKIVVMGLLCLIQSVLVIGVFSALVGAPENGVFLLPHLELFITTYLTAIASSAMGLFVSCLFTNADRAMTVAPILLMPQILFSGMIFKLDGATEVISWLAVCRWSMEGYGTGADLNGLVHQVPRAAESFYEFTTAHLLTAWGILLLFVVGFLLLARIVLSTIKKNNA